MSESSPDASIPDETSDLARSDEAADAELTEAGHAEERQPLSGMEINLGDFTRTQGLMKSLRLTLHQQIVVTVEEIASGVGEAGRKFKMGDLEQANQEITRLYASFGQKTSQWDSRARSLEQQMRQQASKNPKSVSLDALNRMKSEQVSVRTRISTAEVHFRRLHQGLTQACTNLLSQRAEEKAAQQKHASEKAAPENAGQQKLSPLLAEFEAAPAADRPALVRQHFESITPVEVTIERREPGGYEIRFAPRPPRGSLLFLHETGELVRLHELGANVVIENLAAGSPSEENRSEMKIGQFVKLVQAGAWLVDRSSDSVGVG
jgi:hypothetical protein